MRIVIDGVIFLRDLDGTYHTTPQRDAMGNHKRRKNNG